MPTAAFFLNVGSPPSPTCTAATYIMFTWCSLLDSCLRSGHRPHAGTPFTTNNFNECACCSNAVAGASPLGASGSSRKPFVTCNLKPALDAASWKLSASWAPALLFAVAAFCRMNCPRAGCTASCAREPPAGLDAYSSTLRKTVRAFGVAVPLKRAGTTKIAPAFQFCWISAMTSESTTWIQGSLALPASGPCGHGSGPRDTNSRAISQMGLPVAASRSEDVLAFSRYSPFSTAPSALSSKLPVSGMAAKPTPQLPPAVQRCSGDAVTVAACGGRGMRGFGRRPGRLELQCGERGERLHLGAA
mmetsp:Transcript_77547/g.204195  ORF Transcript_77547/g.204195 Transcript_77547/m.204195 type:complete len:303 (-) Transcript_77547:9-917(-)